TVTKIKLSEKARSEAIEAALKELASSEHPSINATALKFGVPEITLR
ncbi:19712_t:CDS:1, partial [Gigaspora rosea]